jgi:acetyl-CoA C-acetyltransferase
MRDVFIVEAGRSPLGKRGGSLSTLHAGDLLASVIGAVVQRSGVSPIEFGQVIGGCVSQVGEQSFNIARNSWLTAGLPLEVAATTVDSQCGSSQQASTLGTGLVGSGLEDIVLTCGVESMSRIPLGANFKIGGRPVSKRYLEQYAFKSQFQGAEMIAEEYEITRDDTDAFGLRSQELAAKAWEAGHFDREVIPTTAPARDDEGQPTEGTVELKRDEGLRSTSLEKLGSLKPVVEGGVHTAGTSSQITDGASAVVLASDEACERLNLKRRARIVYSTIVGVDPITMLKGPIPATEKLVAKTGIPVSDIDVFEVNEAFASVVLAWQKAVDADPAKVNPNGGAIALGHPTGCTGDRLITSALHELERTGGRYGLIAMCCGGGLGTGTIIERLD